jgi:phosphoribosylglycinamide formyltransferase-1
MTVRRGSLAGITSFVRCSYQSLSFECLSISRLVISTSDTCVSARVRHVWPLGPDMLSFLGHRVRAVLERKMTKHIGILLSGRGSNFEALADSIAAGRIPDARVALVISNREGAPGLERAAARKIPTRVIPSKGLEREAYDRQVVAALQEARVDLVCLAGFMRLLSPYFVQQFPGRILNIHPSLLPSFPGLEAQRQALEYGVKFSGCTVHFVDENLDAGPIVIQAVVPVEPADTTDTLAARILAEEHRIYTEAVRLVLSGQYRIEGRRVLPSAAVQGKAR